MKTFLLILLLSLSVTAQIITSPVSGRAIDQNGNGVAMVMVWRISPPGSCAFPATNDFVYTNPFGYYEDLTGYNDCGFVIQLLSKHHYFEPRFMPIGASFQNVDFVSQ